MYPGLTYVGTGKFVGLYGLNESIIDQKATGLQHLFIDDYQVDLVHTACSVVTVDDTTYYGDRIKPKKGHSLRQASYGSSVRNHCIYEDVFQYQRFTKTDKVTAFDESYCYFETEVKNMDSKDMEVKFSALCITQNHPEMSAQIIDDMVIFSVRGKCFAIKAHKGTKFSVGLDAPSGFMYRGIEDILYNREYDFCETRPKSNGVANNDPENNSISNNDFTHSNVAKNSQQNQNLLNNNHSLKFRMDSDTPIASSISEVQVIKPNETYTFKWVLIVGNSVEDCVEKGKKFDFTRVFERSSNGWKNWLGESYREAAADALVALKACNLNGFLPADLTGHYFANGHACFYVRDALMASRAFLYSGHFAEFKQVIDYLMECPLKENGEFYQRYNGYKLPDEGANNNVFSQIDAIGYFTRVLADYFKLTGKLIVDFKDIVKVVDVLDTIETKNNLFGPEGGVNEGVYGPAFITSTNMFIAGGLLGASDIARVMGEQFYADKWMNIAENIIKGCEAAFLEEGYYCYGYVDYHDEKILRYDTPQLLAASLGYPLTEKYKKNLEFLTEYATYFGRGYGYSEQEYHNGPWVFNTAGATQTAYLLGKTELYNQIMKWMIDHQNDYGLLPEAVDARNEYNSFINPLMWANAEFVCCCYVDVLAKCRGEFNGS